MYSIHSKWQKRVIRVIITCTKDKLSRSVFQLDEIVVFGAVEDPILATIIMLTLLRRPVQGDSSLAGRPKGPGDSLHSSPYLLLCIGSGLVVVVVVVVVGSKTRVRFTRGGVLLRLNLELVLETVLDREQTHNPAALLNQDHSRAHLLEQFHGRLQRESRVHRDRGVVDIRREIDKARARGILELVKGLRRIVVVVEAPRDRSPVLDHVCREGVLCKDAFCVWRQRTGSACFLNGVSKLSAANVAYQDLVASVLDDGKPLEFVVAEQMLCFADREIGRWERQWIAGHDA